MKPFIEAGNAILGRFGLRLQAANQFRLIDFLRARNVDVVFDVGANKGQFGQAIRRKGYAGRIVSFEPLPSALRDLRRIAQSQPPWDVHDVALGSAPGTAEINESELSELSSFLQARPEGLAAFPTNRVPVRVETLDRLSADQGGRARFLKIDTQGFEAEVLKGADATLATVVGVQLELPFVQIYEGGWTISEAIDFMAVRGFVPAQFNPTNPHPDDRTVMIEVDCIFRRKDHLDGR